MGALNFDPYQMLAELQNQNPTPATVATLATAAAPSDPTVATVATVAGVAGDHAQTEEFEERAAILEFEADFPREEAEHRAAQEAGFAAPADLFDDQVSGWLARLQALAAGSPTPHGSEYLSGALRFCRDGWASKAVALGWHEIELFGVHPTAPWARFDLLGAAFTKHDVVAVTGEAIRFAPDLTRYRGRETKDALLIWEVFDGQP